MFPFHVKTLGVSLSSAIWPKTQHDSHCAVHIKFYWNCRTVSCKLGAKRPRKKDKNITLLIHDYNKKNTLIKEYWICLYNTVNLVWLSNIFPENQSVYMLNEHCSDRVYICFVWGNTSLVWWQSSFSFWWNAKCRWNLWGFKVSSEFNIENDTRLQARIAGPPSLAFNVLSNPSECKCWWWWDPRDYRTDSPAEQSFTSRNMNTCSLAAAAAILMIITALQWLERC